MANEIRRCLLLLGALACTGGQSGSPPANPVLVPERVVVVDPVRNGALQVEGLAGAVEPAEGVVWALNLIRPLPPVVEPVEPDGSFGLANVGAPGEAIRLQVRRDGFRGPPVDVLLGEERTLTLLPMPVECFDAGLPDVVAPPGIVELLLRNECAEDVRFDVRLQAGSDTFHIERAPAEIPSNAQASISLRIDAAGADDETVVLIEMSDPLQDLRAITVARE